MHSGEPSLQLLAEKKAVPESGIAARDTFDAEGHASATTAAAGSAEEGLAVAGAARISIASARSVAGSGDAAAPALVLVVMSALDKAGCA